MVAGRLEGRIDAAKNTFAAVTNFREFAVDRCGRAYHLAAERIADRLVSETDPEDRNRVRRLRDQVETDAGLLRRAWAGREHNRIGIGSDNLGARHLVIAM